MPRSQRVLSFMSQWGSGHQRSPSNSLPSSPTTPHPSKDDSTPTPTPVPPPPEDQHESPARASSTPPRYIPERPPSRPLSMVMAYQAPVLEVQQQETPPELQPIFTYLSSHSNKLYQEGYFLKLHDLDSRGRPSSDRTWNECFAQLVGTILSLWDAAQLDRAGDEGEVVPTFINLTDASIKMIESLPMNGEAGQALQNVLSISTAANNRYLLHFNSLHSLTQWTAGIRLAMYEHATLQEAYTGSILAGKGKYLNNIKSIMERSRFPTQDWARVRFGAGTPWRRCWCVITPPDEKEFQKAQKTIKKRPTYDRSQPIVKGDIKFYETRKITKKTQPIATITDAFAAYAIYPQSRPLIEQSTLMKVEGIITIHSTPESTTEGFVFVMPEAHHAISGFEMMLRWLIPAFDTFALYGRPQRLIADVLDTRSLMFAMPNSRRYGYLELIDVAGLIHTEGSQNWSEREWRKQLKTLTSKRMSSAPATVDRQSATISKSDVPSRSSLHLPPYRNGGVRFGDEGSTKSSPSSRRGSPPPPTDSQMLAPPKNGNGPYNNAGQMGLFDGRHQRSVSENQQYPRSRNQGPPRASFEQHRDEAGYAPPPPPHGIPSSEAYPQRELYYDHDLFIDENFNRPTPPRHDPAYSLGQSSEKLASDSPPLRPVAAPPAFAHSSGQKPAVRPPMPELQRANSTIDQATLAQMQDAQNVLVQQRSLPQPSNLPSIPGTPSSELQEAFHPSYLDQPAYPDPPSRAPSSHGITRKPVPSTTNQQQVE